MRERAQGWSRRWVSAALALTGAACSGAPLGGNHGSGGDGSGPCPYSTSCLPSGSGGTTGSGGTPGASFDAGVICEELGNEYQMVLIAARVCTPGAPNQCQALVADVPANCPGSACNEEMYVNDGTSVESVRDSWLSAGCGGPPSLCIEIACDPPTPPSVCAPTGICVPASTDGGSSGDAGESCDQLSVDYSAAVNAALACTPGAPNQCQALVSSIPSGCPQTGCGPEIYVNDATAVTAAQSRWVRQCAPAVACPALACKNAILPSTCVANDAGGSSGTCMQSFPIEL